MAYSSVPKPRKGNRRASGGHVPAEAEPRVPGLNVPGLSALASSRRAAPSASAGSQKLSAEEAARLEQMKQERPPHWGNNLV